MEVVEAIKKRRSIRSFRSKPISEKVIKELIELANLAPTASNLKNRRFFVIQDKKTKKKIFKAACRQSQILETPVVIAVATDMNLHKEQDFLKKNEIWGMDLWGATIKNYKDNKKFKSNWKVWKNLWPIQDADATITTLLLAATAKGLAACWIGTFDAEETRMILKLPKNLKVVALICLGYQKNTPYPQKRKPAKELTTWIR